MVTNNAKFQKREVLKKFCDTHHNSKYTYNETLLQFPKVSKCMAAFQSGKSDFSVYLQLINRLNENFKDQP